ncbi:hypothetical protein [Ectopseudomonas mendocina]|uniref:hypothetical protein n=1 Tax=Ectopseudomonas mendocina TaxID=300 RepID=UPI00131A5AAE|nr:hypothetical protein [Pseudomonas mendocina]
MWYERVWHWMRERLTITVPGVVAIFAGAYILMLAVNAGVVGAAWVQAVGSVAAILAAIWVSQIQHQRQVEHHRRQAIDSNYKRTRRLRVFIEHVRAYIAHYEKMGLSTRPAERPYHDQQMAGFQALFGQLLLDEDDLTRQGILSELSNHLYTVQGSYIPGRPERTSVDAQLAALAEQLSTQWH